MGKKKAQMIVEQEFLLAGATKSIYFLEKLKYTNDVLRTTQVTITNMHLKFVVLATAFTHFL